MTLTLTQILAEIRRSWVATKTDAERQILKGLWEDLLIKAIVERDRSLDSKLSINLEGALHLLDAEEAKK